MKIYLASASPRRKMLLSKVGINFQLIKPKYEEKMDDKLEPEEYAKKNAIQKVKSVLNKITDGLIITADTIVVKDNEILGKPKDKDDARRMLEILSGTSHFVVTAIVVFNKGLNKMENKVERTKVFMRDMSKKEIQRYIDSGEPLDAAGAYKIQEKGAKFIKRIEGCYYNVVGLPIATLIEMLKKFNVEV
ncbi:MAG: Maf family protein [Promethearchaeota archaeon]